MFSLLSGAYQNYFAAQQINVLIVGASGSGKTSLLERLKVTNVDTTISRKQLHQVPTTPARLPIDAGSSSSSNPATPQQKKSTITAAAVANDTPIIMTPMQEKQVQKVKTPQSRSWLCPAPARYAQASADSDNEEEEVEGNSNSVAVQAALPLAPSLEPSNNNNNNNNKSILLPQTPLDKKHSTTGTNESMQSIELEEAAVSALHIGKNNSAPRLTRHVSEPIKQGDYNLKPKAKMLPLSKVRPTIGMNLAKVQMCGAQCHIWDLGGRLHDLWERYYNDCDAAVFVFKYIPELGVMNNSSMSSSRTDLMNDTNNNNTENNDNNTETDDKPDYPPVTIHQQKQLLQQVRSAIPDDVPFLILLHCFDISPCAADKLYSTASLLPHYHNPYQALFVVNASNGQGVKAAMEWLIPLARRQQRTREQNKEKAVVE